MVVLAIDPALGSDGGVVQQRQQHVAPAEAIDAGGTGCRQIGLAPAPVGLDRSRGLSQQLVVVDRRVIGQGTGRHFGGHLAVLQHPHDVLLQHPADHSRLQPPAAETGHERVFAARSDHEQHPFLGFAQQKLVGRHALLAGRHPIQVELDAQPPLGRHL